MKISFLSRKVFSAVLRISQNISGSLIFVSNSHSIYGRLIWPYTTFLQVM